MKKRKEKANQTGTAATDATSASPVQTAPPSTLNSAGQPNGSAAMREEDAQHRHIHAISAGAPFCARDGCDGWVVPVVSSAAKFCGCAWDGQRLRCSVQRHSAFALCVEGAGGPTGCRAYFLPSVSRRLQEDATCHDTTRQQVSQSAGQPIRPPAQRSAAERETTATGAEMR